ncbi:alpha-2-macroglobulin receptor-associated protein-like [Actinia tenebrosa]|uniref:Alpha-2-macroglobulin receptor-associated protein-like n=1 Tax=Actinia tenebrosa TaxID=6105 RepID=A0A6P8H9I2_ACTTE|nr:alpha-2-macroglobulin receptor-associated protein-like [Actinia tenebrosa]
MVHFIRTVLAILFLFIFNDVSFARQDDKPFRMHKLNIIWQKVRSKMSTQKLESLKHALTQQDAKELKWKELKAHGGDASGEQEAKLRRNLFQILDKYAFGHLVEGHQKLSEPGVEDNTVREEGMFNNKKLHQLWDVAEKQGKFDNEEMDDLKTEFKHHQGKIEEYNMLLKILQEQHDISDNSINIHERMNENQIDKLKDELKDKYSEMNKHYAELKEKITGEKDKSQFKDYRVVELWERALEKNFSEFELQSIKDELKHFDHKISKHEHFKKQVEKTERMLKAGEKVDHQTHKNAIKKAKEHGRYVKKLHSTLLDRVSHRNEL